MNTAQYTTLRIHPYPWRSEHLNIGVVVLRPDGIRIHLADNLKKVRAFAPDIDLTALRMWPEELQEMLSGARDLDDAAAKLSLWGGIRQLSEQRGALVYRNEDEYQRRIDGALYRLVEPERTSRRPERAHKSRLDAELRSSFTAYGWLSTDPGMINHHIVPRYPLNQDLGLRADFAVQNGTLHIIETIDFRVADPGSKSENAMAKALVLTLAKDAQRYAIVAGGDGSKTTPSIRLLQEQSDHFIRWESAADVNAFLRIMGKATQKPMIELPTT